MLAEVFLDVISGHLIVGRKQIHYDYAKKVQDVYQNALSPPRFQSVMAGASL